MIWVAGNKKKGISVYKLHYKTPKWRVGIWRKGRLYRTYEYTNKAEALREARARARIGWFD